MNNFSLNNLNIPANVPYSPFSLNNAKWHLLGWTTYIAFDVITALLIYEEKLKVIDILVTVFFVMSIFYGIAFGIASFMAKNKKITYGFTYLACFVICYFLLKYVVKAFISEDIRSFSEFLVSEITRFFYFGLLAFGFWFAILAALRNVQKLELENNNLKLQLSLYQNQLSPHFLFNSLNGIYSELYATHRNLAEWIQKMTEMLRYGLKTESEANSLQCEIEALELYLNLQDLRHQKQVFVSFEKNVDPQTARHLFFPKMIFVTLAENIFKHGKYQYFEFPATIRLDLIQKENNKNRLEFEIQNYLDETDPIVSFGIGLQHSFKILHYYFKDKSQTQVHLWENVFHLKLNIDYDQ